MLLDPHILHNRRCYMIAWFCYLILKFKDFSHSFTTDA
nr:MAG TPA: hypothetical protein [Caudoviricetes sp.]